MVCHLPSDRVQKKEQIIWQFSVGICVNYVENKLGYVDKFKQLTKLIRQRHSLSEVMLGESPQS